MERNKPIVSTVLEEIGTVANQRDETNFHDPVPVHRIDRPLKNWGRLEWVQSLGNGGLAEVCLMRQPSGGQLQALKVCLTPSSMAVDRLKREFRMLRSLKPLRFPHSYHLRNFDDLWGFTLRYCDGVTPLVYAKSQNRCDYDRVTKILLQMAVSLAQLHDLGITHGDIKPDNAIVDAQQRVWFLDFGLAYCESIADQLARPDGISGTFPFLAPEVVLRGCYGPASDVYALGRTAFQLLAGKFPSADPDQCACDDEYLARIRGQLPADVPAELAHVVLDMLRSQPSDRPSARCIAESLGGFVVDPRRHPLGSLIAALRSSARAAARGEIVFLKVAASHPIHSSVIQTALSGTLPDVPWLLSQEVDCQREHLPLRAFDAVLGTILSWSKRLPASLRDLVPCAGNPVVSLLEATPCTANSRELVEGAYQLIRNMSRSRLLVVPIRHFEAADPLSQRLMKLLSKNRFGKRILFLLSV